ncbi:MAG: hypothetical protein CFE45_23710 [Burkholderiales bacterium PBB5]|nr:MAG: hypothetical protein CFE45_23710 [Burkholderiales bacterium PBB5]
MVRARSAFADSGLWAPSALPAWQASQSMAGDHASSGFDANFDSRLDGDRLMAEEIQAGQHEMLQHVVHAMDQADAKPYAASFGPEANLLFDFEARLVFIDPLAQQHLRVRRELPQPAPGARPHPEALVRELNDAIWDLGLAAGPFPLLDEPANWWRCPLQLAPGARIDRYSRLPRNLDLARRLAQGPATPSELRRHANVSLTDLRRFIQASLMLHLVNWAPDALSAASAATAARTSPTPSPTHPGTNGVH